MEQSPLETNNVLSDPVHPASRDLMRKSFPLTVVIPVHNSPAQLKLCLDALARNRLDAVEVLIVDDASTDNTRQVAEKAAGESDIPISFLRLERQSGPAAARNVGMRAARNPYVLFLDSDIVLPDHGIESIRGTLDRHAVRPEVAGVMGIYSEAIPWSDFCSDYKNLHVCFLHETTETLSPYLHTAILCIEKRILEEAGGFDTGLATGEDFRMGVKLGSKGYRFVIDRKVQGVHLKRFSFISMLKEDWRRVRDLLTIQLEEDQQNFIYHAHRWTRLLSAALPLPTLAATGLILWHSYWTLIALPLWLMFCVINLSFLAYVFKRRGVFFALKSAALMFIEMLCAQMSLIYWMAISTANLIKVNHRLWW